MPLALICVCSALHGAFSLACLNVYVAQPLLWSRLLSLVASLSRSTPPFFSCLPRPHTPALLSLYLYCFCPLTLFSGLALFYPLPSKACTTGHTAPSPGATSCTSCPAGYACPDADEQPVACQPGSYATAGLDTCEVRRHHSRVNGKRHWIPLATSFTFRKFDPCDFLLPSLALSRTATPTFTAHFAKLCTPTLTAHPAELQHELTSANLPPLNSPVRGVTGVRRPRWRCHSRARTRHTKAVWDSKPVSPVLPARAAQTQLLLRSVTPHHWQAPSMCCCLTCQTRQTVMRILSLCLSSNTSFFPFSLSLSHTHPPLQPGPMRLRLLQPIGRQRVLHLQQRHQVRSFF